MSIVCLCLAVSRALVIPWTICGVTPGQTFASLYEKLCTGSIELFEQFASKLGRTRLAATFVGPAKDNLSAVDSNLPMDDVCRQFGSFARLNCEKIEADSASTSSDVDDHVRPNAFHVFIFLTSFRVSTYNQKRS